VPDLFKNQQFEDNGIKVINSLFGVDMDNTKLKVASQLGCTGDQRDIEN
jgi:hypothetical protein